MALQSLHVALVPQLADGLVIGTGDQRGDLPVPVAVQLLHRLPRRVAVGDGHGGILPFDEGAVPVGEGAAHEGDVQQSQIRRGVVEPSAQKHDAAQTLFPLHDGGTLDLVIARADLLHHQREARVGDGALNGLNDLRVERVGHAAHHKTDGIGLGPHKVPGTVVGNVVARLDGGQHLAPHIVADIGAVVQHAGYGADADAALFGYILYGHGRGASYRSEYAGGSEREKTENISGNVSTCGTILAVSAAYVNGCAAFLPKRTEN